MKPGRKSIGGFFGLETEGKSEMKSDYHSDALALSSGRACLNFICKKVPVKLIYLPFYCCDALIQPLLENKIAYKFYPINAKLEICDRINLQEGELLVYINYFGIKSAYCKKLIRVYGSSLILDYTQSFFEKGRVSAWSFNSARKFFGVPDGGFLYGPDLAVKGLDRNPFYESGHLVERKFGDQQEAYSKFITYESGIRSDVHRISLVSENLLDSLNMDDIKKKRKKNFNLYCRAFENGNLLQFDTVSNETPFAYPLLLEKKLDKSFLYKSGIYIPTLWNDVLQRQEQNFEFERHLSGHLLPLPVDQRYGKEDCEVVIEVIKKMI